LIEKFLDRHTWVDKYPDPVLQAGFGLETWQPSS
jgi:hypothetical protein